MTSFVAGENFLMNPFYALYVLFNHITKESSPLSENVDSLQRR